MSWQEWLPLNIFEVFNHLRQFLKHCIHQIPTIQKSVAMWALSLLHVVALCCFPSSHLESQKWRYRLKKLQIFPSMYTYPFFEANCAVYVKLPFFELTFTHLACSYHQQGLAYVGSTSIGVAKREFNRASKYRQLKESKAVHVELALRYWHSHNNFEDTSIIVLESHTTYENAWVREHCLISFWQTPLNHPFILQHLQLKAEGWRLQFKANQHAPIKMGPRLYQRLRRRLGTIGAVPSEHSHQSNAWKVLYHLGLPSKQSFEACKLIRSGTFDTLEVYALYRLSAHMEEPGRSKVRGLISKALTFRNATVPKKNLPLAIQFLSHTNFQGDVQSWLRQVVLNNRDLAIPFFLPTSKVREAAYPKIRDLLHNHRKLEQRYNTLDCESLPCCCYWLRRVARNGSLPAMTNEHIAVDLDQVRLPQRLAVFQDANANSTYFLAKTPYFHQALKQFSRWLKHHGLPPTLLQDFEAFLDHQWRLHSDHLENSPRLTFQSVKHLLQWLHSDVVIHHADHEQFRITLFCPQLYFQGAWNTWSDPELFESTTLTASEAQTMIMQQFGKRLIHKYSWGFRLKSNLPYGFVFLKRKKQWAKGRTLISYFRSFSSLMMKAASRALDSMLYEMWPQSLGQQSTPQIWHTIHHFFTHAPDDADLVFVNDDLVGFFNSVPQTRLLEAVHSLIQEWQRRHGKIAITVDLSQKGAALESTFSGSFRSPGFRHKSVSSTDIFSLVQASLQTHFFTALGIVRRQIRGAGIGSQISPTLSNLAVTIIERSWSTTYQEVLNQPHLHHLAIRYVDNRFVIVQKHHLQTPVFQTFTDLDFYGSPVELELVDDNLLLGFYVDVCERTVTYKLPDIRQIRDNVSAGTLRLRLSGLKSRAHLIRKYSFPPSRARNSLQALSRLYAQKGFDLPDIHDALWPTNTAAATGLRVWGQTLFPRDSYSCSYPFSSSRISHVSFESVTFHFQSRGCKQPIQSCTNEDTG